MSAYKMPRKNYKKGIIEKNKTKLTQVNQKKTKSIVQDLNNRRPFHLSTPHLLRFSDESLFTKEFMIKVKQILGDPEIFLKMNMKNQIEKQHELEDLYSIETRWKALVKGSRHSAGFVKELFPSGYKNFIALFSANFYPTVKDRNSKLHREKRCDFKCASFCKNMLEYMLNNKQIFPFFTREAYLFVTVLDFDILEKIAEDIDPGELFCEMVKICMKKSYEEGIDLKGKAKESLVNKRFQEDILKAKRTDLQYPVSEYVALYLDVKLLEQLSKKKLLLDNSVEKRVDYIKQVSKHLRSKMKEYSFYEEHV